MLVAIVLLNSFVLVFFLWGIAQLSRDMWQNGVSHKRACVKLSPKGGYRATFLGGVLTSLTNYCAIWGIGDAAIVSQHRAAYGATKIVSQTALQVCNVNFLVRFLG